MSIDIKPHAYDPATQPELFDLDDDWLDTALPSPDDIGPITLAPMVETSTYTVHARSVVVLAVGVKGPAHE